MMDEQKIVHTLYKKLLALYPQVFKEQLGESMEQTFQDLWNEKRQTKKELFSFVLWTFIETAMGIFKEHLLFISPGDIIQTALGTFGSSTAISFLLILPFMVMEVINRRNFNEEFPFLLFFGMWLNLFAISLILLPIVRGRRIANHDISNPVHPQGNTLFTNPKSAAIISVALVLSLLLVSWLDSHDWVSLERLLNSPNSEQLYVFGIRVTSQLVTLVLFLLPVEVGIIAGRPIVRTLRTGGSLFAHPIHLIIVVFILSNFAIGLGSLIMDQWPCFWGIPNCD
jgi:hypothetical protein